ncbi:MAG: hypothetical protein UE116_06385 [Clostridia bacterium]|jgi:hypothetical protein|nr:hypothetical protein [Clostridia bacterium]
MAIKLKCKIKAKHNFKKFEQMRKELPQAIQKGIEEVLDNLQTEAIRLEKGHNQEGIIIDRVDMSTREIKGRIYADPSKFMSNEQSYLWFEYFGTGQYAEQEHIGITKHFLESGYTEWFIPVNKVDRSLGFPIIEIQGMQFYIAHGQEPNHFLQDAEFKTRDTNIETIEKHIYEMLREVCK